MEKLLNQSEFAKLVKKSAPRINLLIKQGRLKTKTIGKTTFVINSKENIKAVG